MTLTEKKLEAALISMAGSFIYLRDMASTLEKKPVIPKGIADYMPGTQEKLSKLALCFAEAEKSAHEESKALVEQWLERVGLSLKGVFRGETFMGYRAMVSTEKMSICGGIESARLHSVMISGTRVVDITLSGAEIVLPDGRKVRSVNEVPIRERVSSFNLTALRDYEKEDPMTKVKSIDVHVRVPIQAEQRRKWAIAGNLVIL